MLLDRSAILGAQDLKTEDVAVPEWNGTVRVRCLTAAERDAYEASFITFKGGKAQQNLDAMAQIRARMVSLTAVNEAGERLFTEADVAALAAKSAAAVNRVFEAAQRLNRVTDEDVKELAGN